MERAIPELEYNRHIKSAKWKSTLSQFYAWCRFHKRFHCWFCGETDPSLLAGHHTRYDHFGNERIEDLALLCVRCHTKLHNALRATFSFAPSEVVKPSFWLEVGRGLSEEGKLFGLGLWSAILHAPSKKRIYKHKS